MFEIALNKCTVLLSATGLEENIPTIEALIWAQRAVPQQPHQILLLLLRLEALWASTPCWTERAPLELSSTKIPRKFPLFFFSSFYGGGLTLDTIKIATKSSPTYFWVRNLEPLLKLLQAKINQRSCCCTASFLFNSSFVSSMNFEMRWRKISAFSEKATTWFSLKMEVCRMQLAVFDSCSLKSST